MRVWLGGMMVGHWTCDQQVTVRLLSALVLGAALGKLFTHVSLSPSSINLVPAQTGKVTGGLVSHSPCVVDSSGITNDGLTAYIEELSTLPTPQLEYAHFTFTCIHTVHVHHVHKKTWYLIAHNFGKC